MKRMTKLKVARTVPVIMVGANKDAIAAATKSILAIIAMKAEPQVLVSALETLRTLCHVTGTTITNCHFEG
jgi:hypothetical protein